MPKKIKKKNYNFWTVNDNLVFSDYWILDRTFINNELIKEIKEFLEFLLKNSQQEFINDIKTKKKEIEDKIEKGSYNNFYDILENLLSFYRKYSNGSKFYLENVDIFFENRNGFKTINLFEESEEFDIFFHRQKILLEKNLSLILNNEEKLEIFFKFIKKNYQNYLTKNKNGSFEFDYEKMSLKELSSVNNSLFNCS